MSMSKFEKIGNTTDKDNENPSSPFEKDPKQEIEKCFEQLEKMSEGFKELDRIMRTNTKLFNLREKVEGYSETKIGVFRGIEELEKKFHELLDLLEEEEKADEDK